MVQFEIEVLELILLIPPPFPVVVFPLIMQLEIVEFVEPCNKIPPPSEDVFPLIVQLDIK